MATYIAGQGGGGKGGGGGARVAQEAPNTLKSKNYAKIIDVLCEGEIEGLVGGLQGIYLDDVPLQNPDGSYNYEDVVVETREGTLAQNITKIGSTTESTVSVGTEIKKSTPVLYTITNPDVDRARLAIQVPALSSQNTSNGDLNGTSVKLKVEYNPDNTGWIEAPVGDSYKPLSASLITGVVSVSGNIRAVSQSTSQYYCTIADNSVCRDVVSYSKSIATIQYQKDGGAWTTVKIVEFRKTLDIPFSFNTVPTSSYNVRVVMSSGKGTITALQGRYTGGTVEIAGKTTSPYARDVEFDLTGTAPWLIRVTRLTDDSTSAALQNKTYLSSVTSVFEEKFRYPATAYVGISIDAEQFSNIPSRAYDVKLLKIKIPTNYDPIARTYAGLWDGTFKVAWSDNPAWCFYDLLTNPRYGLGERISAAQIDKWALYDIAQYCDELVDDGADSLEPRFTCNVLIQTREEAYRVLQDMASMFAGITYWGSTSDGFQGVIPIQDKPSDSYSYIFNNTNVVDGVFSYQTANINTQYNAVYVTYNEPSDSYKQKVVYVSDDDAIAADGYVNDTNIVAFGCTSRAQATRLGRRILYSNRYENDVVSFSVGNEGVIPSIGSVIKVSDELRSGERRGGRVISSPTNTSVELDAPFTLQSGVTYKLSLVAFDASVTEHTITNTAGTHTTLTFTPAITSLSKNAAYIISDVGLNAALFKVVSVTETDKNIYAVSAVSHDPSKYGYIDDLTPLVFTDTSNLSVTDSVTNIEWQEVLYQDGVNIRSKLVLSWTPAKYSSSYQVTYSRENSNPVTIVVTSPSYEILDTQNGIYSISITSVNVLGSKSNPISFDVEVMGKLANPTDVENLSVSAFSNAANISWDLHPDLDVRVGGYIEIRQTPKTAGYKWEDGVPVATANGSTTSIIAPLLSGTYMAKAIDSSGLYSTNPAFADSSFAQIDSLNVIATQVEQTDWNGVKTNLVNVGGVLYLTSSVLMDDVLIDIDDILNFDSFDGLYNSAGEYEFSSPIDLGGVLTCRVSSELEYYAYDTTDTIDSRTTLIDSWESFDGGVINDSFITLYIATTEDDPNGVSPSWSEWKRFLIGDYKGRGFKFKVVVTNTITTNAVAIVRAEVSVDVPDRVVGDDDIVAPDTGFSVVYPTPFFAKPSVAIRIDNMQQGDYYTITNNTVAGFDIQFKNSSSVNVSRQFDYISKGYGSVL